MEAWAKFRHDSATGQSSGVAKAVPEWKQQKLGSAHTEFPETEGAPLSFSRNGIGVTGGLSSSQEAWTFQVVRALGFRKKLRLEEWSSSHGGGDQHSPVPGGNSSASLMLRFIITYNYIWGMYKSLSFSFQYFDIILYLNKDPSESLFLRLGKMRQW